MKFQHIERFEEICSRSKRRRRDRLLAPGVSLGIGVSGLTPEATFFRAYGASCGYTVIELALNAAILFFRINE